MKKKLPKGCTYPDCFNCPLADCVLPDDVDLLDDCNTLYVIGELQEEREQLLAELKLKGIKTKDSKEYHTLSSKIHYLRNIDLEKYKDRVRYLTERKGGLKN